MGIPGVVVDITTEQLIVAVQGLVPDHSVIQLLREIEIVQFYRRQNG